MARLEEFDPEYLDDDQRTLYDSITGGPRGRGPQMFTLADENGRLTGPFNAMLLSPPVGSALQSLGAAVRYESSLNDRTREIVTLVVAHYWGSDFEIYAHEALGASIGLNAVELALLRAGHLDALVDPFERRAALTTQILVSTGDLDDATYTGAVNELNSTALFEITTIVGYYSTLALQLRVYRVSVPTESSYRAGQGTERSDP